MTENCGIKASILVMTTVESRLVLDVLFGDLNDSKCADDVACGRGLTLVEFGDMVPKLCRF